MAKAAKCQMNRPYDQRPNVTMPVLPSTRWGVSGRSSTNGGDQRERHQRAHRRLHRELGGRARNQGPSGPASGEAATR